MGNCLGSTSFCNTRRHSRDDQSSRSCSRGVLASATAGTGGQPDGSQCGSLGVVDASGGVVTLSAQSLNNHLAPLDVDANPTTNTSSEINITSSGRNSTRSNRIVARSNSVSINQTSNTNNNNYQFFSLNNPYSYYVPPTGKSKKLKKDYGKYLKCEKRWGEAQLKAKRDEFWDTAPAFEGKPEIWSALQAAVESLDAKNFELAQAIIDSANIIVPSGLLTDCYDELGNRYQIPVYVLVKPNHLIKKARDAQKKKNQKKKGKKSDRTKAEQQPQPGTGDNNDEDDENNSENEIDDEMTSDRLDDDDYFYDDYFDHDNYYDESSHQTSYSQGKKNKKNKTGKSKTNDAPGSPVETAEEEAVVIKCRMSTLNEEVNSDLKVSVMPSQTVLNLKQQLQDMTNIQVSQQRLFFGGKMMRDKDRLRVHRLKKNVVIQVIVRPGKEAPAATVVTSDPSLKSTPQVVVDDAAAIISPAAVETETAKILSPIVVN